MKNVIFFSEMKSSLRVSLLLLYLACISILQSHAQTFSAPYIIQPSISSISTRAEGTDVFYSDNYCANTTAYRIFHADNCGTNCTNWAGYVNSFASPTPVSSPYIGGYMYNEFETSISKVSVNGSGYISYMGYVDSWAYPTPYVNTFVFSFVDNNTLYPTTYISDILTSPIGNYTYVSGGFTDSIDFGTGIYINAGANRFLAKYSGGTVIWNIILPTNMSVSKIYNLSGGTFIAIGSFSGTINLNGYSATATNASSMFWAKFDTAGTCLGLSLASSEYCYPKSAKLIGNGELWLTGYHPNGAVMGGTTLSGTGAYIAKLDSTGSVLSATHIGSTSGTNNYDADIDADGNVYLITSSTTFAKYTAANVIVWSKSVGLFNPYSNDYPSLKGIGVSPNGSIGIAGTYNVIGGLSIDGTGYVSGTLSNPFWEFEGFFSFVNNPNSATISSPTPTICSGGAATITFNGGAGTSAYTWQQSTNGGSSWYSVSGTNSTTTSTVATLTATRLFRVIYTSTTCGIDTTPVFTLNVVPDPTLTITASNNNFCAGGNTTLTASLAGGVGSGIYQWQQNIGGVYSNIPGATAATYTTPNLTANTTYKMIASQTGVGCNVVGTTTFTVTIKPLPSIYTSPASASICVGGSQSFTAYNGTSYSWSPATGLSATTGSPVVASPAVSTTYSLTGVGTNGCSKTISVPVTVNQDPTIAISGDTTVCNGGTLTLTSTGAGGAGSCTRQWQTSTNGTTWTNIAGATAATYTTPALTATTYYRVTYTCSASGCSPAATSNAHKIHIFNNTLGTVGSPTLCVGGSVKLLAPVMGGTYSCTWTWESSLNNTTWIAVAGVTTTYYYPPINAASAIYYRATASCAGASCTGTATPGLLVTVNPDPSATISGQNSICGSGSTVLTATPAGGAGTHTYQWQENIAGIFTNIAGATNLTYTTPVLTAAKTYRMAHTATGSGCGTVNSANYSISILPLPSIYTSPASATICVGGSSTITAYNGTSYSWSPATGLSATTGSPVTASPTTTTNYSLTGLGSNGCSKTISVPVTVNPDPTISITGPNSVPSGTTATLTATTAGGAGTCTRQWQSSTNGSTWTNISGASAATYTTPAIVGTKYYRATYTCTGSGCSPAATSNVKSIVGIQPPTRIAEQGYEMTLFPNPATVNLTVSVSTVAEEKIGFVISDMLGKTLSAWQGKAIDGVYETEISIENLSQGVYFLSAKVGERLMTQKFVKE